MFWHVVLPALIHASRKNHLRGLSEKARSEEVPLANRDGYPDALLSTQPEYAQVPSSPNSGIVFPQDEGRTGLLKEAHAAYNTEANSIEPNPTLKTRLFHQPGQLSSGILSEIPPSSDAPSSCIDDGELFPCTNGCNICKCVGGVAVPMTKMACNTEIIEREQSEIPEIWDFIEFYSDSLPLTNVPDTNWKLLAADFPDAKDRIETFVSGLQRSMWSPDATAFDDTIAVLGFITNSSVVGPDGTKVRPRACGDDASYIDRNGYLCADWADTQSCYIGDEELGYTAEDQEEIMNKCRLSCHMCTNSEIAITTLSMFSRAIQRAEDNAHLSDADFAIVMPILQEIFDRAVKNDNPTPDVLGAPTQRIAKPKASMYKLAHAIIGSFNRTGNSTSDAKERLRELVQEIMDQSLDATTTKFKHPHQINLTDHIQALREPTLGPEDHVKLLHQQFMSPQEHFESVQQVLSDSAAFKKAYSQFSRTVLDAALEYIKSPALEESAKKYLDSPAIKNAVEYYIGALRRDDVGWKYAKSPVFKEFATKFFSTLALQHAELLRETVEDARLRVEDALLDRAPVDVPPVGLLGNDGALNRQDVAWKYANSPALKEFASQFVSMLSPEKAAELRAQVADAGRLDRAPVEDAPSGLLGNTVGNDR